MLETKEGKKRKPPVKLPRSRRGYGVSAGRCVKKPPTWRHRGSHAPAPCNRYRTRRVGNANMAARLLFVAGRYPRLRLQIGLSVMITQSQYLVQHSSECHFKIPGGGPVGASQQIAIEAYTFQQAQLQSEIALMAKAAYIFRVQAGDFRVVLPCRPGAKIISPPLRAKYNAARLEPLLIYPPSPCLSIPAGVMEAGPTPVCL